MLNKIHDVRERKHVNESVFTVVCGHLKFWFCRTSQLAGKSDFRREKRPQTFLNPLNHWIKIQIKLKIIWQNFSNNPKKIYFCWMNCSIVFEKQFHRENIYSFPVYNPLKTLNRFNQLRENSRYDVFLTAENSWRVKSRLTIFTSLKISDESSSCLSNDAWISSEKFRFVFHTSMKSAKLFTPDTKSNAITYSCAMIHCTIVKQNIMFYTLARVASSSFLHDRQK